MTAAETKAPMGLKDCRVGALMAVSDLDTARRFYEDQLGLVPGEQEQEGVRYFCAEGTGLYDGQGFASISRPEHCKAGNPLAARQTRVLAARTRAATKKSTSSWCGRCARVVAR
jgi:catechol-2,3-dioxygenase